VDVSKADEMWSRHQLYLGPRADARGGKYGRFGRWLLQDHRIVEMAEVFLFEDSLAFINGRHRFAWMRDHGAKALPLAVSSRYAERLNQLLGTGIRSCVIRVRRIAAVDISIGG
jgi:hypothetical protein